MKKCKDFCDRLSDYLDKELGENECILIEEHLDNCGPCSLIFEGLKTTVLVCSKGISDEVPEEVRARLKQFLRNNCRTD
ncbi:MAG: zf-HC2 domain-containing protein [Deltaproteobacteria bacterium]|nr:zf-HC2 domain-containing protein [Deltaproteobacteria bacterium]